MAEEIELSKVLRVTKHYRNGKKVKHLIVTIDAEDDFEVWFEDAAVNWAENDPAGANYGYKVEWEEEKDKKIIDEVISKEIENLTERAKYLRKRKKYLKTLQK